MPVRLVGFWLYPWFGPKSWEMKGIFSPLLLLCAGARAPSQLGSIRPWLLVIFDCISGSMEKIILCLLSLLEIKLETDKIERLSSS